MLLRETVKRIPRGSVTEFVRHAHIAKGGKESSFLRANAAARLFG